MADDLLTKFRDALRFAGDPEREDCLPDPFQPWQASTDYHTQTCEWWCYGCNARGHSKWPRWKLNIEHEPGCRWVAYREAIDAALKEDWRHANVTAAESAKQLNTDCERPGCTIVGAHDHYDDLFTIDRKDS